MSKVETAVEVFHPERILSAYNAGRLTEWVGDCLATGHKTLLIDFKHAYFMDSSGLGALTKVLKLVKQYGGELALSSVKGQIQMILEMTSMEEMFDIYPNQEAFLKEHKVLCCSL
jgi:anti-anti-sigma factor